MLAYPVRLNPTPAGTVRASFPDVPEAVAEGKNEEDALNRARFVLEMALGHYVVHGRLIPVPSDPAGAPVVETAKFDPHAGTPHEAEGVIGGGRY